MGFNYDKFKQREDKDSLWTSYSDLFMGLSFVFLLLYVVASLRVGAGGFQLQSKISELSQENTDLKSQLKIYESTKNQYLEDQASDDERKMYDDLMKHLDLLQDDTKEKNKDLQAQIKANSEEERALNQYQQMIRNVINKNMVAKTRIIRRDQVIGEQDVKLEKSAEEISDLRQTVDSKQKLIAQNEAQIQRVNTQLSEKMNQLKASFEKNQITEQNYKNMMKTIRENSRAQVSRLKEESKAHQEQIALANVELQKTQEQLAKTEQAKHQLEGELKDKESSYGEQIASLQKQHAAKRAKDLADFERQLEREKLSASDRAAKEAEFRAKAAAQERELSSKIAGLQDKLTDVSGELAKAKAEIEARKSIADEIKKGFAKAGIEAEVDPDSGDVVIDFGDHYFESGRAELKPGMAEILKKAMPVYSKALLGNQKVADNITSLEIVGFASPTYQGRVVDPRSLDPKDKQASDYNLDLSYSRARSIYQYIYDPSNMEFGQQVKLRSMTKVSGKSFFDQNNVDRSLASLSAREFCQKVNCKTSQRVMIKFTVDRKK